MARQMIDPLSGLPIQVIGETHPSRAVNPFSVETPAAVASPATPPIAPPQAVAQPTPLAPSSFLDKVLFTIFGPDEANLSPEEQKEAQGKRKEAGDLSRSAALDPGEAHMGISSAGGGSFGDSIMSIMKLFMGGPGGKSA